MFSRPISSHERVRSNATAEVHAQAERARSSPRLYAHGVESALDRARPLGYDSPSDAPTAIEHEYAK